MKLEEGYKVSGGRGESTQVGYSVEARYEYSEPAAFGSQIFDKTWRRVTFDKANIGIPQCRSSLSEVIKHGFLGYQAAQALRWWFHAAAESESFGAMCLETRIIKHEIKSSYEVAAISCHEHVSGDNRSNIMPDWGEK